MDYSHCPSHAEYQGVYNVDETGWKAELERAGSPQIWDVDNLPELTFDEFWSIRPAAYEVLYELGHRSGWTDEESRSFYEFCVGDELLDRTIRVELPDFDVLSPRLVFDFQQDILDNRPLWRVMVVGMEFETSVVIYPKVVRAGTTPADANWIAAIPRIKSRETTLREPLEGPDRRQAAHLQSHLPGLISRLSHEHPFLVAGLFDRCGNDPHQLTVWMLHRDRDWAALRLRGNGVASSIRRAVAPDGDFGYHFKPQSSSLWLTRWVIPADGPLDVIAVWKPSSGERRRSARLISLRKTLSPTRNFLIVRP